jgi:hypothetical protein
MAIMEWYLVMKTHQSKCNTAVQFSKSWEPKLCAWRPTSTYIVPTRPQSLHAPLHQNNSVVLHNSPLPMAAFSFARTPSLCKPQASMPSCSQRSVPGCRRSCVVVRADHFRLNSSSSSGGGSSQHQRASIRAFDPTTSAPAQPPATSQQGGFSVPLVASGIALVGVAAILYKKLTGLG